jgi:hypothetical protein
MPNESGVDLNRNFDFNWQAGSDPCSDEYPGTGPFSEPETQALKSFVERMNFSSILNLHAYGNILTIPFNSNKTMPVAHQDMAFYNQIQSAWKFDAFGPSHVTLNYTTFGESDDWYYGAHGILSMSPEIGLETEGFRPKPSIVRELLLSVYPKIKYWIYKAGGPEIAAVSILTHNDSWNITFRNNGLAVLNESDFRLVVDDGKNCHRCDTSNCELYKDGRIRVLSAVNLSINAKGGTDSLMVGRCDTNSRFRRDPVSVCLITSGTNCRCFTTDSNTSSELTFKRPLELSNYWASPLMCRLGGLTDYTDALSNYGSDASNWFELLLTIIFVLLVAVALIHIVRTRLLTNSNNLPATYMIGRVQKSSDPAALQEAIE